MNAQAALGVVPAFLLSLLVAGSSVGLCEYRGRECSGQWNVVYILLGLGGGSGAGYAVGYNTLNPNLRTPRKRNEKGQFTGEPQ